MEAVMSETGKVLVDVKAGNNLLYLPLDKMMEHQPAMQAPSLSGQSGIADQPQSQSQQNAAPTEQAVERASNRSRDARGR
jgi:membrane protease subunit HflK